jgi:L-fuconolactonase
MISRRNLLRQSSALALVSAARPSRAAEPSRIIDAHVHFYDPTRPQGVPWPLKDAAVLYKPTYPDRYLASISPFPVDGVVAVEASSWLDDNRWLLEVADRSNLVWAMVGNIPPGQPDFKAALRRYASKPLFRGIRINAGSIAALIVQSAAVSDLKLLASMDLSLDVLLNGTSSIADVARLAASLPELRIVAGHLPFDSPADTAERTAYRENLRVLGKAHSVYAKVSSVVRRVGGRVPSDAEFYRPALDELWQAFGPERLIYASNWPVCELIAPYSTVFRVVRDYLEDKDRETVERYFWKNAQAAYKLRPRA